jgi:hypothetical protein
LPLSLDDLHLGTETHISQYEDSKESEQFVQTPTLIAVHKRLQITMQELPENQHRFIVISSNLAILHAYFDVVESTAAKRLQIQLSFKPSGWISDQQVNRVDEEELRLKLIKLVRAIIRQLKAIIRCLLGIRLADYASHTPRQIVYIRRYTSHEAQQGNEDSHLRVWWPNLNFFGATSGTYTFSSAA